MLPPSQMQRIPLAIPFPTESLSIGGSTISVEIGSGDLNVSRTQIHDWVRRVGSRRNRILRRLSRSKRRSEELR